jgi:pimeloyl-ACP methyl ester carboxylesterase
MIGMARSAHEGTCITEAHVEADGFRLRYIEAGQGRPVVMLHGAGGLVWTKLHDDLAKRYRVLAFEMPGFGQSAVNLTSQSVPDLARTMAQAATQLGLESYALIGTSFGGRVALWQALLAPQAVDLLVLIAPTAVLPEGYTLPSVTAGGVDEPVRAPPQHTPALPVGAPAYSVQAMALMERLRGINHDAAMEEKLGEVQALTLVVFGTADRLVPPDMGRIYRERMPNCHYVLVYDAGHEVASERPEALTNAVIDFLDWRETFIVSRRDGRINP